MQAPPAHHDFIAAHVTYNCINWPGSWRLPERMTLHRHCALHLLALHLCAQGYSCNAHTSPFAPTTSCASKIPCAVKLSGAPQHSCQEGKQCAQCRPFHCAIADLLMQPHTCTKRGGSGRLLKAEAGHAWLNPVCAALNVWPKHDRGVLGKRGGQWLQTPCPGTIAGDKFTETPLKPTAGAGLTRCRRPGSSLITVITILVLLFPAALPLLPQLRKWVVGGACCCLVHPIPAAASQPGQQKVWHLAPLSYSSSKRTMPWSTSDRTEAVGCYAPSGPG